MVFIRLLLSIILQYYQQIMAVDPNLGKEMGREFGDEINQTGNEHMTSNNRIFQITLAYSLMLYSLYSNLDIPLTFIDYMLFVIGTIGVIICFWTYRTLGEFYTFTIGIRKNHYLVKTGPYQYIMHPGYLGQILLIVSTTLFYNFNMFVTCILLMYVGYVYCKRIVNEESMLELNFALTYQEYKLNRKRLIPYLF
jgi:protein-S-isoprenylcysteine O-methyltransferase Ste14